MLTIRPEDTRSLDDSDELIFAGDQACDNDPEYGCFCVAMPSERDPDVLIRSGRHLIVYGRKDGQRYTSNAYYCF